MSISAIMPAFMQHFDIVGMVYAGKSFSISAQDTNVSSIWLSADGTKLYALGTANKTIYQYTLSMPWDISTATYASKSFLATAQYNGPYAISLSIDGSKLYINGSNGILYQYTLSTPWDISTSVYANKQVNYTSITGAWFSPSGQYIFSAISNNIQRFTLATPWDVSTASGYIGYVPPQSSTSGIFGGFSPDGRIMTFLDNAATPVLYKYFLGTPWDITTAAYSNQSFTLTGTSNLRNFIFSIEGAKMYFSQNGNNTIPEYYLP